MSAILSCSFNSVAGCIQRGEISTLYERGSNVNWRKASLVSLFEGGFSCELPLAIVFDFRWESPYIKKSRIEVYTLVFHQTKVVLIYVLFEVLTITTRCGGAHTPSPHPIPIPPRDVNRRRHKSFVLDVLGFTCDFEKIGIWTDCGYSNTTRNECAKMKCCYASETFVANKNLSQKCVRPPDG